VRLHVDKREAELTSVSLSKDLISVTKRRI